MERHFLDGSEEWRTKHSPLFHFAMMQVLPCLVMAVSCEAALVPIGQARPISRVGPRMGLFGRTTEDATAPRTGLWGRFRGKRKVESPEEIVSGAMLPEVDVQRLTMSDADERSAEAVMLREAFQNGTALLVGMPGAFTPT